MRIRDGKILIRDPGWKKVGSGINIPDPDCNKNGWYGSDNWLYEKQKNVRPGKKLGSKHRKEKGTVSVNFSFEDNLEHSSNLKYLSKQYSTVYIKTQIPELILLMGECVSDALYFVSEPG